MNTSLIRAYPPSLPVSGPTIWLLIRDGALLVRRAEGHIHLLISEADPRGAMGTSLYLGTLGGMPCLADDLGQEDPLPPGTELVSLRALYGQVSEAEYALAGYASQALHWRRTSVFCPVCGHATEAKSGDWGRHCPHCGHTAYPPISPAVLILIHDGAGHILLGHKPGWGARYSILAGFAEPGESLEDCVRREAKEEVDVDVMDLSYAGSQPWPFPNQLMIGFTARYAGGDVRADAEELDDARWFTVHDLPELPTSVSLSRRMINAWIAAQGAEILS